MSYITFGEVTTVSGLLRHFLVVKELSWEWTEAETNFVEYITVHSSPQNMVLMEKF